MGQVQQWYTPVIPELRRQKQEDQEFKSSLDYRIFNKDTIVHWTGILEQKVHKVQ
jgi:hypothetical protein